MSIYDDDSTLIAGHTTTSDPQDTEVPRGRGPTPPKLASSALPGSGHNPLVQAATHLLSLGTQLRHLHSHDDIPHLRQQIGQKLQTFEQDTRDVWKGHWDNRESLDYFPHYILCGFLDEMVLSTPWGHNSSWAQNHLQMEFHRNNLAGEYFFTKVFEYARRNPRPSLHLLELMSFCLALGFKGRPRELDKVRREIYDLIIGQQGPSNPDLSPQWKGVSQGQPIRERLPVWVILTVLTGLSGFTYGGFYHQITEASGKVQGHLDSIKPRPQFQVLKPPCIALPLPFPKDYRVLLTDFNVKETSLSAEHKKILEDKLFSILRQAKPHFDKFQIDLYGRASTLKSKHNQEYSDGRANSLKAWLLGDEMPAEFKSMLEIVNVKGLGTTDVLPPEPGKTSQQTNQSVEIRIVGQKSIVKQPISTECT